MKSITSVLGILLIIAGILLLTYEGYSYTEREAIVQIGNVQVTADTQKHVHISPWFGGLSLAAGIILVVIGTREKKL